MSDERDTDERTTAEQQAPDDLAGYDALPEADDEDSDGSVERIDIGDNEGPELVTGEETSDSVAPRPGH
jgi:hypothetical protein